MIVKDKKTFLRGSVLLASFTVIFILMLMPVMHGEDGTPQTGLEYADVIFNELSKGSSYFIPEVNAAIKPYMDTPTAYTLPLNDDSGLIRLILEQAGAEISVGSNTLSFNGYLGKILNLATQDANLLYHNDGAAISRRYDGNTPLDVARAWWQFLNACVNVMQKDGKVEQANIVDMVIRKAIEPGNNFYSIKPINVSDHIILIIGLLSFYILYAIWYGFGIYDIFEGLGLVAKEKKS